MGQGGVSPVSRARTAASHDRPRPSLVDQTVVVHPVVVAGKTGQQGQGSPGPFRILRERIGDGQEKKHQSLLVLRVDVEDIEADALGLRGLAQKAIPLGAFQGGVDAALGQRLERGNRGAHGRWSLGLSGQHAKELLDRIVEPVRHPFLQGDDGVVGDVDALRAHRGAALGDVAVADPVIGLQILETVLGVDRIHFEGGGVDEETRPYEFLMEFMVAQNVTDILAQEALDALAEFLGPIDVLLSRSATSRRARPLFGS